MPLHAECPEAEEQWIACPSTLCQSVLEGHQQGKVASTTLACGLCASAKCVSLGTQDVKTGPFLHCPIFIPQGLLVLHFGDYLEAIAKILGESAPSSC
jgi:hypothetical protein